MEWYVMIYDMNKRKVVPYNIFHNSKFSDAIDKLKEKLPYMRDEEIYEFLDNELRYCFWCKAEYEVLVGDLFIKDIDTLEKIDVYTQMKPNIKSLAYYIVSKLYEE